jgi:fluoroacetyl-CoA thioesterase
MVSGKSGEAQFRQSAVSALWVGYIVINRLKGTAMKSIPVGTAGSFSLDVQPEHLASRFKDVTLPPVLATPIMIMMMENAARNAIKPYLDAGESALGTRVDVRHLGATPVGRHVMAEARVTHVEGPAD